LKKFTFFSIALLLIFQMKLSSQVKSDVVYYPTTKWKTGDASRFGISKKSLHDFDQVIISEFKHLRSFLISVNGYIIYEKYGQDFSNEKFHEVCSVTKSITSALIGVAITNGFIDSLNQTAVEFFPEYADEITDARFKKITIKHLLTMSPGFECGENPCFDLWQKSDNPTQFIFNTKVIGEPGNKLKYNGPAVHLLSAIISKVSGTNLLDFGDKYLFSKLGIKKPFWYTDPQVNNWGNFRSLYRPRDLMKIGYLFLNNGRWENEQIISKDHIEAATSKQISGKLFGFQTNYGYLWYVGNYSGIKTFNASGYGGQYLYVIPEAKMIVVCTSNTDRHYGKNYGLIGDYIIPLAKEIIQNIKRSD
jgi:CubicO group peptidase (beta-lactamase class C family)